MMQASARSEVEVMLWLLMIYLLTRAPLLTSKVVQMQRGSNTVTNYNEGDYSKITITGSSV